TGLVASLARPGGNVTGLSIQQTDLAGKRLELLREVIPSLRRLAMLVNVGNPLAVLDVGEVQAAARTLGLEVITLEIRRGEDITPAFDALKGRSEALYVVIDPLVNTHRIRINTLVLAARLPTMHTLREGVEAGGLMSYGANFPDVVGARGDFGEEFRGGGEAGHSAGGAADKVRPDKKFPARKSSGPEIPAAVARRRGGGNKMI